MGSGRKFFILGFLFFTGISVFLQPVLFGNLYFDFLVAITVSVTTAVGILRGPRAGAAFGFSSLFAYSLLEFLYGYPVLFNLSYSFVRSVVMALYGYLPAKLYLQNRRIGRAFVGFFSSLFLDLVFSLSVLFLLFFFEYGSYEMPYVLISQLSAAATSLVIGGISTGLCVKYAKPPTVHPRPQIHLPSVPPYPTSIRCPKCGHENPENFIFCGSCGTHLAEDETRIY